MMLKRDGPRKGKGSMADLYHPGETQQVSKGFTRDGEVMEYVKQKCNTAYLMEKLL